MTCPNDDTPMVEMKKPAECFFWDELPVRFAVHSSWCPECGLETVTQRHADETEKSLLRGYHLARSAMH